jgi:hypothetical protein
VQVVEEGHALAYQFDLLDVVELQPKCAGCDWSGQCCQGRTLLENEGLETGTLGEECRRATDDAPADDDEVGGVGR